MFKEWDSEKNFENRIIVSEVMAKSLVSCFLTHRVDCDAANLPVACFRSWQGRPLSIGGRAD